jgi:hypothetical protein
MLGVTERDVQSLLELVYEAGASSATESFPPEFIDGLARLISSDAAGFQEACPGQMAASSSPSSARSAEHQQQSVPSRVTSSRLGCQDRTR